jgi:hypothetical protein
LQGFCSALELLEAGLLSFGLSTLSLGFEEWSGAILGVRPAVLPEFETSGIIGFGTIGFGIATPGISTLQSRSFAAEASSPDRKLLRTVAD